MKTFGRFLVLSALLLLTTGEECPKEKAVKNRNHLFDQGFGLALTPDDFLTSMIPSMMTPFGFRDYFRPWRHMAALARDLGSTIKADKDNFQINLDVQHFAPEEIKVKTADGYVIVEAKHEEKKDEHGLISRQFVRKYSLPEGVEPDTIISQLSSDGILTVSAPLKHIEGKERIVPITQTGPVRKEAKESNEGTCDKDSCEIQMD